MKPLRHRPRYWSDRSPPILPPRRKNWTKGTPQIGIFIRTPDGGQIEMAIDRAGRRIFRAALELLHVSSSLQPLTKSVRQRIEKLVREVPTKIPPRPRPPGSEQETKR